jgi:hypothetical protein
MKQVNVINIDDPAGKTVGRRRPPDPLCTKTFSIQRAIEWQRSLPVGCIPKGVFRFNSHEEADLWMRKNIRVKKS